MPVRGGRWPDRPNLNQIEELAVRQVAEFRRKLVEAGLTVPSIPPVPAEYLALTNTKLSVRGITGLTAAGKRLAGLLDPHREEICYEENDPSGRQSFSIAHELGHYFLHYLPALEAAQQPALFEAEPTTNLIESELTGYFRKDNPLPALFYRCTETEVDPLQEGPAGRLSKPALSDPIEQAKLAKIIRRKERADRLEWEANIFARGLLMPKDLVRWVNTRHGGEVKAMAEELGVTQTALRYRLNGLGLRQDENMGLPLKDKSKKTTSDQASFF